MNIHNYITKLGNGVTCVIVSGVMYNQFLEALQWNTAAFTKRLVH